MDMQTRNTGRAKTFSAPVGSRTYVRVETTMSEYGALLQYCGVTGGLGLRDKVRTCHVKCLIHQTLILAVQCDKLLHMNFSFTLIYEMIYLLTAVG
jgi:hypothetical protein